DTSFLANVSSMILGGVSPNPGYVVRNNTLVSATFPDVGPINTANGNANSPNGIEPGVVDKIYRPYASSETKYLDLNGKYRASTALTVSGKAGTTRAVGQTPGDMGYEAAWATGGLQYAMNGLSRPAVVTFPGVDTTNFNDPAVFTNGAWNSVVK